MTYQEALHYILSLPRGKSHNGLQDMKDFLKALGDPQRNLKFVHVAGTNGKGSTNFMIAKVLEKAGYKVGLNLSPYITRFNERMQISGVEIPDEELADLVKEVKPIVEKFQNKGITLVQFEVVTAIALVYFYKKKCDIVCLEVGIGGLLDSTNVMEQSEVSVIASVSLDHTEILGSTVREIALQKGGILKPKGEAVFYCDLVKEAKDTLIELAEEKRVNYHIPLKRQLEVQKQSLRETRFSYKGENYLLHLPGLHQVYNALSVIEACEVLRKKGWKVKKEEIQAGIEGARFPARIELITKSPTILLDGSHNPEGIEALCSMVDGQIFRKKTAIVAMKKGKDTKNSIKRLEKSFDKLLFTEFSWNISSKKEELLKISKEIGVEASCIENFKDYLKEVRNSSASELFVFCGSLYFASEIRPLLLEFAQE